MASLDFAFMFVSFAELKTTAFKVRASKPLIAFIRHLIQ